MLGRTSTQSTVTEGVHSAGPWQRTGAVGEGVLARPDDTFRGALQLRWTGSPWLLDQGREEEQFSLTFNSNDVYPQYSVCSHLFTFALLTTGVWFLKHYLFCCCCFRFCCCCCCGGGCCWFCSTAVVVAVCLFLKCMQFIYIYVQDVQKIQRGAVGDSKHKVEM